MAGLLWEGIRNIILIAAWREWLENGGTGMVANWEPSPEFAPKMFCFASMVCLKFFNLKS